MTHNLYLAADLDRCLAESHHLKLTWSDKTPLKVSLMCTTCSLESRRNAYVAYGDDKGSWGQWRKRSPKERAGELTGPDEAEE